VAASVPKRQAEPRSPAPISTSNQISALLPSDDDDDEDDSDPPESENAIPPSDAAPSRECAAIGRGRGHDGGRGGRVAG
jgi:hypothetical protein